MYTVNSPLATEGSTYMHLGISSLMHKGEGPLVQREVCPLYSDGLVHKFRVISHLYTMCQPTCAQRFSCLYKAGHLHIEGVRPLVHEGIGPHVHIVVSPLEYGGFSRLVHRQVSSLVHLGVGPLVHKGSAHVYALGWIKQISGV
jgi:hypothetical protein